MLLAAAAALAQVPEDDRARALDLYDGGEYTEALPLLQQLDAAGEADGPLLYRLYYCLRHAGDPAAREALERARTRLEQEVPGATDLEPAFYLANALRNVGRLTDAGSVARHATDRVENGSIPEPVSGVEMFRLGKLYADQERIDEATRWYERAIEALTSGESSAASRPYVNWAGRFLAEQAWQAEDYARCAASLALLQESGLATIEDLDRLAVASFRNGDYARAKSAWQAAERANPTDANRPRYCWRLAGQAERLAPLPELAPDERSWAELSQGDLETLMIDQVTRVRETQAEAGDGSSLKKKQRRKMQAEIDDARVLFVTAALEYAARGHSIRELAFFNGFAPMVFHDRQWALIQADASGAAQP
jgi:tetratricopeptide (TPR) repeat protein